MRCAGAIVVVAGVEHDGGDDLLLVAEVGGGLGGLLGLSKDGEEDGGENGDDRNDHQKFNEREGAFHEEIIILLV